MVDVLHVLRRIGKEASIADVKSKVLNAYLLATGQEVKVLQKGGCLFLRGLPRRLPDLYDSMIRMELEGKPEAYFINRFIP